MNVIPNLEPTDSNRIVMQQLYVTSLQPFKPWYQYCYDSIVEMVPEVNEYNVREGIRDWTLLKEHYKIILTSGTYYIPTDYAAIYNECINPLIATKYEQGRHFPEDDTVDYFKDVLEYRNIDLKKNYRTQHNGDYWEKATEISKARVPGEEI
jgi:hypothetical protein